MITDTQINGMTHDFAEFIKNNNLDPGKVGLLLGIVMKNLQITKITCEKYCTYSKSMNQVFPRKCIKCGNPENQQ